MYTTSQVLIVLGLIFESISVLLTIRKLFFGYHKRINEMGKTFQQKIKKDKIEGTVVLIFLIIGMTLQGISVFIV